MKKIQNFQDQQLTSLSANNVKGGGASQDWKNAAMGFCEWYVSLGSKGTNSGFLTFLNGVAEDIANS